MERVDIEKFFEKKPIINGIPVDHYDADGHPIDAWGDRMDITPEQIQQFRVFQVRAMKQIGRQPIISAKPIRNVSTARQTSGGLKVS